jgi:hypothetical protein
VPGPEGLKEGVSGVAPVENRRCGGRNEGSMVSLKGCSRAGVQSWTDPGEQLPGRDAGVGRNGAPVLGWYGGLGASDWPECTRRELDVELPCQKLLQGAPECALEIPGSVQLCLGLRGTRIAPTDHPPPVLEPRLGRQFGLVV